MPEVFEPSRKMRTKATAGSSTISEPLAPSVLAAPARASTASGTSHSSAAVPSRNCAADLKAAPWPLDKAKVSRVASSIQSLAQETLAKAAVAVVAFAKWAGAISTEIMKMV